MALSKKFKGFIEELVNELRSETSETEKLLRKVSQAPQAELDAVEIECTSSAFNNCTTAISNAITVLITVKKILKDFVDQQTSGNGDVDIQEQKVTSHSDATSKKSSYETQAVSSKRQTCDSDRIEKVSTVNEPEVTARSGQDILYSEDGESVLSLNSDLKNDCTTKQEIHTTIPTVPSHSQGQGNESHVECAGNDSKSKLFHLSRPEDVSSSDSEWNVKESVNNVEFVPGGFGHINKDNAEKCSRIDLKSELLHIPRPNEDDDLSSTVGESNVDEEENIVEFVQGGFGHINKDNAEKCSRIDLKGELLLHIPRPNEDDDLSSTVSESNVDEEENIVEFAQGGFRQINIDNVEKCADIDLKSELTQIPRPNEYDDLSSTLSESIVDDEENIVKCVQGGFALVSKDDSKQCSNYDFNGKITQKDLVSHEIVELSPTENELKVESNVKFISNGSGEAYLENPVSHTYNTTYGSQYKCDMSLRTLDNALTLNEIIISDLEEVDADPAENSNSQIADGVAAGTVSTSVPKESVDKYDIGGDESLKYVQSQATNSVDKPTHGKDNANTQPMARLCYSEGSSPNSEHLTARTNVEMTHVLNPQARIDNFSKIDTSLHENLKHSNDISKTDYCNMVETTNRPKTIVTGSPQISLGLKLPTMDKKFRGGSEKIREHCSTLPDSSSKFTMSNTKNAAYVFSAQAGDKLSTSGSLGNFHHFTDTPKTHYSHMVQTTNTRGNNSTGVATVSLAPKALTCDRMSASVPPGFQALPTAAPMAWPSRQQQSVNNTLSSTMPFALAAQQHGFGQPNINAISLQCVEQSLSRASNERQSTLATVQMPRLINSKPNLELGQRSAVSNGKHSLGLVPVPLPNVRPLVQMRKFEMVRLSFVLSGSQVFLHMKETYNDLVRLCEKLEKQVQVLDTYPNGPQPGAYIIAQFNGDWYRGKVLETYTDGRCRVLFCDYGDEDVIYCSDIRNPGNSKVFQTPFFAYHLVLENIRIVNETQAADFLRQRCENKEIRAVFNENWANTEIRHMKGRLYNEFDKDFSKELVKWGLAEEVPETQLPNIRKMGWNSQ